MFLFHFAVPIIRPHYKYCKPSPRDLLALYLQHASELTWTHLDWDHYKKYSKETRCLKVSSYGYFHATVFMFERMYKWWQGNDHCQKGIRFCFLKDISYIISTWKNLLWEHLIVLKNQLKDNQESEDQMTWKPTTVTFLSVKSVQKPLDITISHHMHPYTSTTHTSSLKN